jgi:hypothetical protein
MFLFNTKQKYMRKIYTYNIDKSSLVQNSQTLLPTACSEAFGVLVKQQNHPSQTIFKHIKMKKFLATFLASLFLLVGMQSSSFAQSNIFKIDELDNNSPCSEAQHQENRRTEFKIFRF